MSTFGVDYVPQSANTIPLTQKEKAEQDKIKKASKAKENYNVKQSKIAIGSGGLWGKGFLKGTQTQGNFVPEQHTDFIFTSVGENFGFWGSSLVVILYILFMLRIIFLAERQRSTFSRVYAYSVASIIFFHVSINICMTIGLAPVIGITLPLLSYGGSSLLTFTILIFILVRLDADRNMVLR
jgi:rod shape determining protein RodA